MQHRRAMHSRLHIDGVMNINRTKHKHCGKLECDVVKQLSTVEFVHKPVVLEIAAPVTSKCTTHRTASGKLHQTKDEVAVVESMVENAVATAHTMVDDMNTM